MGLITESSQQRAELRLLADAARHAYWNVRVGELTSWYKISTKGRAEWLRTAAAVRTLLHTPAPTLHTASAAKPTLHTASAAKPAPTLHAPAAVRTLLHTPRAVSAAAAALLYVSPAAPQPQASAAKPVPRPVGRPTLCAARIVDDYVVCDACRFMWSPDDNTTPNCRTTGLAKR